MPALTQGPLPARVYWVRRLMVLGTAVLLVVAIAHLLGNGSDGSSGDGDAAARLSADRPSSTAPTTDSSPSVAEQTEPTQAATTSAAPVLAAPSGTCQGSDIAVTPKVQGAVAGRDVMVVLQVRTMSSPACTWRVSADAVAVNITSGKDSIWTSRDCRRAIPHRDVVVRKDVTTDVGVVWTQAKRSDEDCSPRTTWALPGWYHVTAAALGGEPSDAQFELATPTAATVTVTAKPKQSPTTKATTKATGKATAKPGKKATKTPSKKPSQSPSGAVEPDQG